MDKIVLKLKTGEFYAVVETGQNTLQNVLIITN